MAQPNILLSWYGVSIRPQRPHCHRYLAATPLQRHQHPSSTPAAPWTGTSPELHSAHRTLTAASQLQNANMQLCLCLKQEPQLSLARWIRKCSQIGTATAHYSIWHDSNIESLKLPLTASMQLVGSTTPYRQVHMLGPNVLCIVQLRRTRNDFLSEAHCNMPPSPPGRHRQPEEMLCNFLASQCLCLLWSSWLPDHDWAKTNHNIEKEDAKSRKLLGTWKDAPIQSKSQSQLVYSFLAMQDDNQWGIGRTGARENDLITSQDNWLKCSVKVQIHEGKTFPNKSLACVPLQKLFEDKPFDIQIVYPCTACTDMHLSVYEKWYVIIRAKIWVAGLHSAKLSDAARLLFLSKWSHCSLDRFVWFNPWGSAKCCNGGAG